jgi:hypothetical protein|tara:strand:- start:415 stop:618 length:204 start_codon:yes stop_codon:yes gene_type:complete
MFEFIKKKFNFYQKEELIPRITNDGIEKSLWDIKEVYDLETEEVERVVCEKRIFQNLRHKGFKENNN